MTRREQTATRPETIVRTSCQALVSNPVSVLNARFARVIFRILQRRVAIRKYLRVAVVGETLVLLILAQTPASAPAFEVAVIKPSSSLVEINAML